MDLFETAERAEDRRGYAKKGLISSGLHYEIDVADFSLRGKHALIPSTTSASFEMTKEV